MGERRAKSKEAIIQNLQDCFAVDRTVVKAILDNENWNMENVLSMLQTISPKVTNNDARNKKSEKKSKPSTSKFEPGSSGGMSQQGVCVTKENLKISRGEESWAVVDIDKKTGGKKKVPSQSPTEPPRQDAKKQKRQAVKNAFRMIQQKKNPADRIKDCIKFEIKILVLMRGCPGSGKSTYAREILSKSGVEYPGEHIFSTDNYFYDNKGNYNYDRNSLERAHSWNQELVEKVMKIGLSPVVVDNTNCKAWEMMSYAQMAVRLGYVVETLQPNTPWFFNDSVLAKKNSHGVPKHKIALMLENYETGLSGSDLLRKFGIDYQPNQTPPLSVNYQEELVIAALNKAYAGRKLPFQNTNVQKAQRKSKNVKSDFEVIQTVPLKKNSLPKTLNAEAQIWSLPVHSGPGSSYFPTNPILTPPSNSNKNLNSPNQKFNKYAPLRNTVNLMDNPIDEYLGNSLLNPLIPGSDSKFGIPDSSINLDSSEFPSLSGSSSAVKTTNDEVRSKIFQEKFKQVTELFPHLDKEYIGNLCREEDKSLDDIISLLLDSSGSLPNEKFSNNYNNEDCSDEEVLETQNDKNLNMLYQLFPNVKHDKICEIYEGYGKDFRITIEWLLSYSDDENDEDLEVHELNKEIPGVEFQTNSSENNSKCYKNMFKSFEDFENNVISDSNASKTTDVYSNNKLSGKYDNFKWRQDKEINLIVSDNCIEEVASNSNQGEIPVEEDTSSKSTHTRFICQFGEDSNIYDNEMLERKNPESRDSRCSNNSAIIDQYLAELNLPQSSSSIDKLNLPKTTSFPVTDNEMEVGVNEADTINPDDKIKIDNERASNVKIISLNDFESAMKNALSALSINYASPRNSSDSSDEISSVSTGKKSGASQPVPTSESTQPSTSKFVSNLLDWDPKDASVDKVNLDNNPKLQRSKFSKSNIQNSSTNTNYKDFELLKKCENFENIDLHVVTGNPFNFESKIDCNQFFVPQNKLLLDKGTTTAEVETHTVDQTSTSQLLSAMFPGIPSGDLDSLLNECKGDLDWAVGLLLDDGHEISNNFNPSEHKVEIKQDDPIEQMSDQEIPEEPVQQHPAKIKKNKPQTPVDINFVMNDESISSHVKKIRNARLGIVSPGALDVPSTSAISSDAFSSSSEDEEEEEETIAVALSTDFVLALQAQFGGYMPSVSPDNQVVVKVPVYLARQLHSCIMDSLTQQLEEEQRLIDKMIQEDECLARQLQELEGDSGDDPHQPQSLQNIMDQELALNIQKSFKKGASGEDTVAGKLAKQLLIERFPNLDPTTLSSILADTDHSLYQATQLLEAAGYTRAANCSDSLSTVVGEEKAMTREEMVQQASAYRQAASMFFQMRTDCFTKAQAAYSQGNKHVASYYSQMANWHTTRIEEANMLASTMLLSANKNSTTLDLHFLRVCEAVQVLDLFLDAHISHIREQRVRKRQLYIITGRGLHSHDGRSKIRPATITRLKQREIWYQLINPGLLMVYVSSKTPLTYQK